MERRQSISSQLNKKGISFNFFDAVNGDKLNSLPSNYARAKRLDYFGSELTRGEIGCLLSHREIWKFADMSNSSVLILEDDIVIQDAFVQAVTYTLESVHPWDLFRLWGNPKSQTPILIWEKNERFNTVEFLEDPDGAVAYVITPEGSRKLLRYTEKFYRPVDNLIEERFDNKIKVLSIYPFSLSTNHFASTIGERIKNSDNRPRKPILRMMYKSRRSLKKLWWQITRHLIFFVKNRNFSCAFDRRFI